MGFVKEFKAFAVRGNVMDLAVGVIIGAAFGKIVTALVEDLLMPIAGMVSGKGEKFNDKFVVLTPAKPGETYSSLEQARTAGANIFAYGHFIQTIVDFLIIALCIFMLVRTMTRIKKRLDADAEAATPPPAPSSTDKLLMEIRDALKK